MRETKNLHDVRFAFLGTSHRAVYVLEELVCAGFSPVSIITIPDKRSGRGLRPTAPAVKTWACTHAIEIFQPETLRSDALENISLTELDVCIVADYGKIIPKTLLNMPKRGFLNIHPSLLPRFRGPSPTRSAILHNERTVGVSIIVLDEQLDHGPIVIQKKIDIARWPPKNSELEKALFTAGGKLLAQVLPQYVSGYIEPQEQDHSLATYCRKFIKDDGNLDLSDDPYKNLLKIYALEGWPGTYTFFERHGTRIRTQILDAHIENNTLVIDRVRPENGRDMSYEAFLRSGAIPIKQSRHSSA